MFALFLLVLEFPQDLTISRHIAPQLIDQVPSKSKADKLLNGPNKNKIIPTTRNLSIPLEGCHPVILIGSMNNNIVLKICVTKLRPCVHQITQIQTVIFLTMKQERTPVLKCTSIILTKTIRENIHSEKIMALHHLSMKVSLLNSCKFFLYVIVITFYSPSCLGQETAKGPFGLRVKLPPV